MTNSKHTPGPRISDEARERAFQKCLKRVRKTFATWPAEKQEKLARAQSALDLRLPGESVRWASDFISQCARERGQ